MIEFDKIHFIKGDEEVLLFHYPSYTLLNLGHDTAKILISIKNGEAIDEVAKNNSVSVDEINNCLNGLGKIIEKNQPQRFVRKNDKKVYRITLHISNDCNLRCRYCYANGGDYKMTRRLMTKETAKQFYEFCIENFVHIEKIVFFGGEPCLNIDVMEYICDLFNNYNFNRELKTVPKFCIITNGTILNQRLLNLIDRYISIITVSVDGPKDVNDFNRIDKAGNGSYDRIERFIVAAKQCSNVLIQYESTYTDTHKKMGISQDDLISFFKKRFGIEGFIMPEISTRIEDETFVFDNINNLLEVNNLPECFADILWAIYSKRPLISCQISKSQFAISSTGEIFPCHRDVGTENLNLGCISGENIFNSAEIQKKFPLFNVIHDKSILCPDCWAQNLCERCSRDVFFNEKTNSYGLNQAKEKCDSLREYVEKILLLITELRKDKKMWQQFIENAMRNTSINKKC